MIMKGLYFLFLFVMFNFGCGGEIDDLNNIKAAVKKNGQKCETDLPVAQKWCKGIGDVWAQLNGTTRCRKCMQGYSGSYFWHQKFAHYSGILTNCQEIRPFGVKCICQPKKLISNNYQLDISGTFCTPK